MSAGSVNSEPGIGSGRRRPDSSGSPSCMRYALGRCDAAVLAGEAQRDRQVHELDALFAGVLALFDAALLLGLGAAVHAA